MASYQNPLDSFMGAAIAGDKVRDNRTRLDQYQQTIDLAEETAQSGRNVDTANSMMILARQLDVTDDAGMTINTEKLSAKLQQGRDSNSFDPKVQQLVTMLGNEDAGVKTNPDFEFNGLTRGPDGTLTLKGNYKGDDKKNRFFTVDRESGDEAKVAFSTPDQVAALVADQYNQQWTKPGVSKLYNELESREGIRTTQNTLVETEPKLRLAVSDLTNQLENAIVATAPDRQSAAKLTTDLKRVLAGQPYHVKLEILRDYGGKLQLPVDEVITPEVEEAAQQSANPQQEPDSDAEQKQPEMSAGQRNRLTRQLELAEKNLAKQQEIGDRGKLGGGMGYVEQAQARVDKLKAKLGIDQEDLSDPNPAIEAAAKRNAGTTDEDIIEGNVQMSREEVLALQKALADEGITSMAELYKTTKARQQQFRNAIAVMATDKETRRDYVQRFNNAMATGSPDLGPKDIATQNTAQQNADSNTQKAATGVANHLEKVRTQDWKVEEKIADRIRDNFNSAEKAIYGVDSDGELNSDINFDEDRFFTEYSTAFSSMYREYRNAKGAQAKAQTQIALNSMISMGIQALAESEEYGSLVENFIPDGGISYIDQNDALLSRLEKKPDGSVVVVDENGTQMDESVPKSVLKRIFGNEGYAYFIREIEAASGSVKDRANKNSGS